MCLLDAIFPSLPSLPSVFDAHVSDGAANTGVRLPLLNALKHPSTEEKQKYAIPHPRAEQLHHNVYNVFRSAPHSSPSPTHLSIPAPLNQILPKRLRATRAPSAYSLMAHVGLLSEQLLTHSSNSDLWLALVLCFLVHILHALMGCWICNWFSGWGNAFLCELFDCLSGG